MILLYANINSNLILETHSWPPVCFSKNCSWEVSPVWVIMVITGYPACSIHVLMKASTFSFVSWSLWEIFVIIFSYHIISAWKEDIYIHRFLIYLLQAVPKIIVHSVVVLELVKICLKYIQLAIMQSVLTIP